MPNLKPISERVMVSFFDEKNNPICSVACDQDELTNICEGVKKQMWESSRTIVHWKTKSIGKQKIYD